MQWNDCIVFIMAKSYQKLQGEFKKLLEPYGLTTLQFLTLALLSTEQDISAADICDRLLIDKSTLSGVLERLEENLGAALFLRSGHRCRSRPETELLSVLPSLS